MMDQELVNNDVFCLFAGEISQETAGRFFRFLANCTTERVTHVHCMLQTTGGAVGDGIALYNLFKALPIPMSVYNAGSVCSIGVIAFLGAKRRVAAPPSAFMIHRTQGTLLSAVSESFELAARSVVIDDMRIEAILRAETTLSEEHWRNHKLGNLWLDALEAKEAGIATEVGNWQPPKGCGIYII